ncbi:DUF4389 domain-containing protein [Candidatus Comchoanobacter bicostacola]|uniref:DUF4389 domain-containing protein n=1 Tax=Candidatus Comchoanobacter bicostacola TaxID=2919598 RepID=UPI003CCE0ADE
MQLRLTANNRTMNPKLINDSLKRVFFLLLIIILSPISTVIMVISLIQIASEMISGKKIEGLMIISKYLIKYYAQIANYITGIERKPPFPFSRSI